MQTLQAKDEPTTPLPWSQDNSFIANVSVSTAGAEEPNNSEDINDPSWRTGSTRVHHPGVLQILTCDCQEAEWPSNLVETEWILRPFCGIQTLAPSYLVLLSQLGPG